MKGKKMEPKQIRSKESGEWVYACPKCGTEHYEDAEDCCIFVCSVCGTEYSEDEDALDCCEWDG